MHSSNNAYWLFTAFTGMFLLSPIVDYMVEHISRETAIKAVWIIGLLGFYGLFSAGELKDPLLFKSGRGIIWFTCLYFIGATVRKHELYKVNVSKTALIGLCSFVLNGFLMLSLDKFIGNTFDDYFLSALSPLLLVTSCQPFFILRLCPIKPVYNTSRYAFLLTCSYGHHDCIISLCRCINHRFNQKRNIQGTKIRKTGIMD